LGTTRLTAIFGDPVEHSLSPTMHNAAYAALRLDRRYVAFHVTPRDLVTALRGIRTFGILGVNLTVPHKEAALRAVDNVSAEGELLGAINCVINRDGKLAGDNTDARGLEHDLRSLRARVNGSPVIIVGAGGGAASAALAASRLGASRVLIANRTRSRAAAMARRCARTWKVDTVFEATGLELLRDGRVLAEVACVINATPMGLTTGSFTRLDYGATPPDCFFYDMLYSRKPTPFLQGAVHARRKHADGAGMLIDQGELAFKLFNAVAPPRGVMRRALMEALGRK
jgi:shikimate dehydrogenase